MSLTLNKYEEQTRCIVGMTTPPNKLTFWIRTPTSDTGMRAKFAKMKVDPCRQCTWPKSKQMVVFMLDCDRNYMMMLQTNWILEM